MWQGTQVSDTPGNMKCQRPSEPAAVEWGEAGEMGCLRGMSCMLLQEPAGLKLLGTKQGIFRLNSPFYLIKQKTDIARVETHLVSQKMPHIPKS